MPGHALGPTVRRVTNGALAAFLSSLWAADALAQQTTADDDGVKLSLGVDPSLPQLRTERNSDYKVLAPLLTPIVESVTDD